MNKTPFFAGLLAASVCFLLTLALTGLYFVLPARIQSGSEQLSTFPIFSLSSFFSGEYQSGLEQALKDQFALRDAAVVFTETIKAGEKDAFNSAHNVLRGLPVSAGLVPFGKVYRMNATDWLTNMTFAKDEADVAAYEKKAAQINALATRNPNVSFFVYYCTRAEDMAWFDSAEGVRSFSYAELLSSLLSPDISFSRAEFADLHDYSLKMYKTDHHWNSYGAWTAYQRILNVMKTRLPDLGTPRRVIFEKNFGGLAWQGSRCRECGVNIAPDRRDKFTVYVYDLPPFKTYYGGRETSLGLAEDYDAGNIITDATFDQYLNYYGFEAEPITLDFGHQSGHRLLIIGDSFTRALREPLASHFDKALFLNFRILSGVDIDALIRENDIDAVLFMGQQDAWSDWFFDGEANG